MSTLTRKDGWGLSDLFEWLEIRPSTGQIMRIEEGVENGRYVIRAEMPGIDPEKQADVRVSKGILTINAEREDTGAHFRRSEFRYGSFTRHVTLPASADEADIEASYDRGMLEISVGLKAGDEAADAGRRIPVRPVRHIRPT